MGARQSKREIDKEQMYKKLMPSGLRTIRAEQEEDDSAFEPQKNEQTVLQPLRHSSARREVPVPLMQTQNLSLVNTMEVLVMEKLDSAMSRMKCCKCDRCKKDIVAIALNKLPPKYRVIEDSKGTMTPNPKLNAQVITAIIQAILIVRDNPRH